MFNIGSSLPEARTRQNLDFEEMEQRTKVRAKYLRLLEDERFSSSERRLANRLALNDKLSVELARFTRDELEELAATHRLTLGPVLDVEDILGDAQYRARETVVMMDDETVLPNVVPRLDRTPAAIRTPAPALGAPNAEVYSELGLDPAKLAAEGLI